MNDLIINVLPIQGPTIPIWVPLLGGFPINSPIVGSIIAIVVSVTIAMITIKRTGDSNRRYIETVKEESERHIEAVEKTSADQIKEKRYWRDLNRKQRIKLLIQEFETNVFLYNKLLETVEENVFTGKYFNFILVAIEKCLTDTPIDNNDINHNLLVLYYSIKVHDNKINTTRTPGITKESLEDFIRSIARDYEANQELIKDTIAWLKRYEQEIELHPPTPHQTSEITGTVEDCDLQSQTMP